MLYATGLKEDRQIEILEKLPNLRMLYLDPVLFFKRTHVLEWIKRVEGGEIKEPCLVSADCALIVAEIVESFIQKKGGNRH